MEEEEVDAKEEMKWEKAMIQIDLLIKNLGNIVEEVIAEIIDMRKGILEVGAEIEVEVEAEAGVEAIINN